MVRFVADCGLGNLTVRHMSRFLSRLGATTWSSGANTSAGVSMPMGLMQWWWRFFVGFSISTKNSYPTTNASAGVLLVYCWSANPQHDSKVLSGQIMPQIGLTPIWWSEDWADALADSVEVVRILSDGIVRWMGVRVHSRMYPAKTAMFQPCKSVCS